MERYDIAIIGAGPGGYVAAIRAAQSGARTLLIEKAHLGGTCLNWGCIPSKTMLASAELYLKMKESAKFGVTIGGSIGFDWKAVVHRKNKVVQTLRNGIGFLLKKNSIVFKQGIGRIDGLNRLSVISERGDVEHLEANSLIIAVGSHPAMIPSFHFDGKSVLTSNDIFDLEELPDTMIIVGAGVIGCEFATLFSAFGVKVTLLELLPDILQTLPIPDSVRKKVATRLKKQGVDIIANARISNLGATDGEVKAVLDNGSCYTADRAVVSIGRTLNTMNIGLEDIGITFGERNSILVNSYLQTNYSHIYAIGDITGNQQLAHLASRQGLVAVDHVLNKADVEPIEYAGVPSCVFTFPPVGLVGLSEVDLIEQDIPIKTVEFQFRALGISHAKEELDGSLWLIADQKTDQIYGGGVFGSCAPDLIHTIALGVVNRLTIRNFYRLVTTHPTFSESLNEALELFHGKAIHL